MMLFVKYAIIKGNLYKLLKLMNQRIFTVYVNRINKFLLLDTVTRDVYFIDIESRQNVTKSMINIFDEKNNKFVEDFSSYRKIRRFKVLKIDLKHLLKL